MTDITRPGLSLQEMWRDGYASGGHDALKEHAEQWRVHNHTPDHAYCHEYKLPGHLIGECIIREIQRPDWVGKPDANGEIHCSRLAPRRCMYLEGHYGGCATP